MTTATTTLDQRSGTEQSLARNMASRLLDWVVAHQYELVLIFGLVTIVSLANAWNFDGYPGRINDDEGTYTAQAWALLRKGEMAHYTYWYDHPPLGWITIAGYMALTNGFERAVTAVTAAREFMVIVNAASCVLLYWLALRLHFSRAVAVAVVLLFGLSPLAIHFHRMVFLDNLAVMWMLAAFVIVTSPRRSLNAAVGSAFCFALAVLSKETTAVLLPAMLWQLWQHTDPRTRRWNVAMFLTTFGTTGFFYVLYAILKNELLPGEGHVSLAWALWWQLFGRGSSGSLLNTESGTFALFRSWVDMDPWLLLGGLVLIPAGLYVKRLRAVSVALAIQLLMMFRGGYMPYPYVIAMLPFAALIIGGVADSLLRSRPLLDRLPAGRALDVVNSGLRHAGTALVVLILVVFGLMAVPQWSRTLSHYMTVDAGKPSLDATRWVERNLPHDAVLVVDDYLWTDLKLSGFEHPIWFYKVDLDPAVQEEYLRNGYAGIDYLVLGDLPPSTLNDLPTVAKAVQNSLQIATFGDGSITVRRVNK